jgi:hypothetical protein
MKCYGCGIDKDVNTKEIYPYEEDSITDEPICPLSVIECETEHVDKAVVVCNECYHKLQPDMWISERCWNAIDPVVSIEKLPDIVKENKWKPLSYPDLGGVKF